MTVAPRYPRTTWECGCCGKENPGDIGECTRCRGGHLERGGLMNGMIPYFPVWHVQQHMNQQDQPPYKVHDGYLPTPEKYPY